MSFVGGADRGTRGVLRHQEVLAADALADLTPAAPGLGWAPVAVATAVSKAAPAIVDILRRWNIGGGGISVGDRAQAIWKQLPPEAINSHVGAGGWWYDNDDNHQLSYAEADARKQAVAAAAIGSHVGDDGWWYDNQTNQQLSYQDALDRYSRITVVGSPPISAPAIFKPTNTLPRTAPTLPTSAAGMPPLTTAGLTPTAMVIGLGVLVAVAFAMKGRRR